ncbi:hypothetical protein C8Q79DRAFT_997920 [Trametes meyenii]|nr:hypothetical protein C8Q79DRAFT_997920 [Trametes meyenii]
MSSAGPSRPRVLTLTADQLLGTSLTPARPHKQNKNAPRVLTIEDLLGTGLTVARPTPRPAPKPAARSAPRPAARASASTRSAPNPRLVRVTADEVLRTGIPVRTLQVVKARSGQAQVLTAEELLAAGSSRSPARGPLQVRGRAISVTAEQLAGSSGGGSSSRGNGTAPARAGASSSQGAGNPSTSGSRGTRPAPGQTSSDNQASAAAAQSRNPRTGQGRRRSASLGSMRTLPIYTQEPGESEVVIDRGATELEDDDEIPITVMSPVDENEPNADGTGPASAGPTSSPPGSPSPTDGATLVRQISPVDLPEPEPSSLSGHLPPWTSLYADAAPSYEAAMSTPNLHMYPESPVNVPLPSSPILIPAVLNSSTRAPEATSSSPESPPQRPTVRIQTSPSSSPAHTSPPARGTASPISPEERGSGTETPRRRFGFMSLFHSRSSSRLRSRSHSHSHASPPPPMPGSRSHSRADSGAAAPPRRVASPDLAPPPTRPFHRLSQSASGSMLDLMSRSRADN